MLLNVEPMAYCMLVLGTFECNIRRLLQYFDRIGEILVDICPMNMNYKKETGGLS